MKTSFLLGMAAVVVLSCDSYVFGMERSGTRGDADALINPMTLQLYALPTRGGTATVQRLNELLIVLQQHHQVLMAGGSSVAAAACQSESEQQMLFLVAPPVSAGAEVDNFALLEEKMTLLIKALTRDVQQLQAAVAKKGDVEALFARLQVVPESAAAARSDAGAEDRDDDEDATGEAKDTKVVAAEERLRETFTIDEFRQALAELRQWMDVRALDKKDATVEDREEPEVDADAAKLSGTALDERIKVLEPLIQQVRDLAAAVEVLRKPIAVDGGKAHVKKWRFLEAATSMTGGLLGYALAGVVAAAVCPEVQRMMCEYLSYCPRCL